MRRKVPSPDFCRFGALLHCLIVMHQLHWQNNHIFLLPVSCSCAVLFLPYPALLYYTLFPGLHNTIHTFYLLELLPGSYGIQMSDIGKVGMTLTYSTFLLSLSLPSHLRHRRPWAVIALAFEFFRPISWPSSRRDDLRDHI